MISRSIEITRDLVIMANDPPVGGEPQVTINAGHGTNHTHLKVSVTEQRRVLTIAGTNLTVHLVGLTLTGGNAKLGGGLRNDGTLCMWDCVVRNNIARVDYVGAGARKPGNL